MKKRMISLMLCALMALTPSGVLADTASEIETNATAEGSTLNIFSYDTMVYDMVTKHLPGYTVIDDTHGSVIDEAGNEVTIAWRIFSNDDSSYENRIDTQIYDNPNYLPDDRIDLFTADTGFLKKYTGSQTDLVYPLLEFGFTVDDLASQFNYTRKTAMDSGKKIRAASITANLGVMIYYKKMAENIFGDGEPETITAMFSTLDGLRQAEAQMAEADYTLTETTSELYYLYDAMRTTPWVKDGKVTIDPAMKQWAADCRTFMQNSKISTADLYSKKWLRAATRGSKCLSYFASRSTFLNYINVDAEESIAADGGWVMVPSAAAFTEGDQYIMAARGNDNPTLSRQIIRLITMNDEVMGEYEANGYDMNNKRVLKALMQDPDAGIDALGGQNPYQILVEASKTIDVSAISEYDGAMGRFWRSSMENYIKDRITYAEAVDDFKRAVQAQFSGLKF